MKKGHKMTKEQINKAIKNRKTLSRHNHPLWNGGIRMANGYITILMPEHPYCNKKGYVRKHRLVMEAHIGRVLLPTEVVHHINGIRTDNRIENLMLFNSCGEHQRLHSNNDNRRDKYGRFRNKT